MKLFHSILIIGLIIYSGCNNKHKNLDQDGFVYKLIDSSKITSIHQEPYRFLYRGNFTNNFNKYSPDPIFNYTWNNPDTDDSLQIYFLRPVKVMTNEKKSFENIESLLTDDGKAIVHGKGSLMFDFGIENAAWLEFESPDFNGEVTMSIS